MAETWSPETSSLSHKQLYPGRAHFVPIADDELGPHDDHDDHASRDAHSTHAPGDRDTGGHGPDAA